ncbi:Triacylglycerol lipase SDP1 [Porphyridium purpureum]|uniref:Triacylglycerol lipase SDP1 n=1 Tax=Porphyridium purpureum TaxID=35688 RepID=A0A5J4YZN0_PORPP|nr:Triacylglycerol lipase SDP1 [Porphyridium purpureum]|eukprot:POR4269..scf208_2
MASAQRALKDGIPDADVRVFGARSSVRSMSSSSLTENLRRDAHALECALQTSKSEAALSPRSEMGDSRVRENAQVNARGSEVVTSAANLEQASAPSESDSRLQQFARWYMDWFDPRTYRVTQFLARKARRGAARGKSADGGAGDRDGQNELRRAPTRSGWYELNRVEEERLFDANETGSSEQDVFGSGASVSVHRWLEKWSESEDKKNRIHAQGSQGGGALSVSDDRRAALLLNVRAVLRLCFLWWFDLSLWWIAFATKQVGRMKANVKRLRKSRDRQNMVLIDKYKRQLKTARSYAEYYHAGMQLDVLLNNQAWKVEPVTDNKLYDANVLLARLIDVARLYKRGDVEGLMFSVRSGLVRNLGGICNPELHAHSYVGSKRDVEDYLNVMVFLLIRIAKFSPPKRFANQNQNFVQHKLNFFNETRHAYGRTALMLSGGSTLGLLHLGVGKALIECNLLPRVVCGTSAGALVASLLCTLTRREIAAFLKNPKGFPLPTTGRPLQLEFFDSTSPWKRLARFVKKGTMFDVRTLTSSLRENLGDLTFEEAYMRTRRILNISVSPLRKGDPPLLLNYLTTPNVLIWSAAAASCALPVIFAPVHLVAKNADGNIVSYHPDGLRWQDGSVDADIPLSRISELFSVNHFVVSQVNPHVAMLQKSWLLKFGVVKFSLQELQFRLWQLFHYDLVPESFKRLYHVFMQPYTGDVNLVADVRAGDWLRLFQNPTVDMVSDLLDRGASMAYPKIDEIRHHCLIELTLQGCVDYLSRGSGLSSKSHSKGGGLNLPSLSSSTPLKDTFALSRENSGGSLRDTSLSAASRGGAGGGVARVPSWLWANVPPAPDLSTDDSPDMSPRIC